MLCVGEVVHLSASDLVGHLNCRYLTSLDLAVARGERKKPFVWDPLLEVLAERGPLHEQSYLEHLEAASFSVVKIGGVGVDESAVASTLKAMRDGAPIIAQGALRSGRWGGRTDILRRVETPSDLGDWSYEVTDTKLARETTGNTILQLCLYSDLLADTQKLSPECAYVVRPGADFKPQAFRLHDYAAYYRRVRIGLQRAVESPTGAGLYPEPKPRCEICRWRLQCNEKWREDDHLTFVAGISKSQIAELGQHGIATLAALATVPLPLPWKPERGAERIREQARLQLQGRAAGAAIYQPLTPEAGFGLSRLPPPSDGDIFFDLKGDPFVDEGGLEFLFGYAFKDATGAERVIADWALSRADEKAAFERFVDFVIAWLDVYPSLHVYHYAPYEPGALKRLMGRYVTRENEIDRMLRAGVFVDLYAVVRHAIRASVESYSIKKLEPLYDFQRTVGLPDAGAVLAKVQASLELGDFDGIGAEERAAVAGYNRDDCLSAWRLRDWLEEVRSQLLSAGAKIERPEPLPGDAGEDLTAWQQRIAGLVERLTLDVPVERDERSHAQHGRWLLAHILDWHRRENKATWWEYYRLSELSADELLDERAGLSGLSFIGTVDGTQRAPIDRYRFPPQDTDLRGGEGLRRIGGEKFGKVESISLENRTVDIKKRKDTANIHPEAVFAHDVVDDEVLAEALVRLGDYVAQYGLLGDGPHQAARDLLLLAAPRISGESFKRPDETPLAAAMRIAPRVRGVLPIQGPPGTGKTYIGARMICTLTQDGKTIGITANSHKVIRNILDEVLRAASELGVSIDCVQKVPDPEPRLDHLQFTTNNATFLAAIGADAQIGAATAWFWARADAFQSVDTLFIDEAAQMSLANVLAVSQSARNIVLLGDPQQLEQLTHGSHPEGTDVSALTHILGLHATILPDRGLFLCARGRARIQR